MLCVKGTKENPCIRHLTSPTTDCSSKLSASPTTDSATGGGGPLAHPRRPKRQNFIHTPLRHLCVIFFFKWMKQREVSCLKK